MSVLLTREHDGQWEVWLGLADDVAGPPPDGYSFIIGVGPTRGAAVAQAVDDLARALGELRSDLRAAVESARAGASQ